MYVTFIFFIVVVCLLVCLSWWGGVRASHGSAGGLGPGVRGSTLFLGAGGRNYSHPRFINSAAPAPVRVRQRCLCPSTYPPSSHSPSSFSFSLGRGRAFPPLAPPRLTSDALDRLHLLPPFPTSLPLPPPPDAPSAPYLDGQESRRPGSRCPPCRDPCRLSGCHFTHFQSLLDFLRPCGFLCCVLWVCF